MIAKPETDPSHSRSCSLRSRKAASGTAEKIRRFALRATARRSAKRSMDSSSRRRSASGIRIKPSPVICGRRERSMSATTAMQFGSSRGWACTRASASCPDHDHGTASGLRDKRTTATRTSLTYPSVDEPAYARNRVTPATCMRIPATMGRPRHAWPGSTAGRWVRSATARSPSGRRPGRRRPSHPSRDPCESGLGRFSVGVALADSFHPWWRAAVCSQFSRGSGIITRPLRGRRGDEMPGVMAPRPPAWNWCRAAISPGPGEAARARWGLCIK